MGRLSSLRPRFGARLTLAALAAAAVTGCGSSSDEPAPGVDAGTGELELPAIPGGGTTGGSILGRLVVYVLRAGAGIPDVDVAVDTITGRRVAVTDDEGRIELTGPDLRGPVAITAFREDGPHYTLAGVDAAGVSLDIAATVERQPQTAFAVGTVSGWTRLPAAAGDPVAEVLPIVENVLAPSLDWAQAMRPGADFTENVVLPVAPFQTYRLRLDATNTTGVFARAGRVTTPPAARQEFDYLAIRPGLRFTEGATVAADLRLDTPLDRRIRIDTSRRPGLTFVALLPILRLPDGGGFVMLAHGAPVEGEPIVVRAPRPSALDGSEAGAVALARDTFGQQTVRWFPFYDDDVELPEFLAVPTPVRAGPRAVEVPAEGADMLQWTLTRRGQTVWRMDVVGPARRAPAVWPPAIEGYDDPVPGERWVSVVSLDFGGIDPDRVSFTQLSILLRGLALGFATVTF